MKRLNLGTLMSFFEYIHPVNNYYAIANICDIFKSIETITERLQQHRIYRIIEIFSNFGVN